MSLNSYKQWKLLNEALGGIGPFTLGLSNPQSVGVIGAQLGEEGEELEEAKKAPKGKKKMGAEIDIDAEKEVDDDISDETDDDISDETDDETEVDKVDIEDDDDEETETPEEEEEEEEGEEIEDGEKITTDITKKPMLMKKKCKKGMKKAMKKEDRDWWNSVNSMLLSDPDTEKSWDGFSKIKEDALLPPVDANEGLADAAPTVSDDPQPGEPGFAPQTRFGL